MKSDIRGLVRPALLPAMLRRVGTAAGTIDLIAATRRPGAPDRVY